MQESSQPKPIATGTLSKTPFAHLLVYVDQHRLSGSLLVWPEMAAPVGNARDRVLFRAGRPVAARLLEPAASLQDGLLRLFSLELAPYAFYGEDLLGTSEGLLQGDVDPLALVARSLRSAARDDWVDTVLSQFASAKLRMRPDVQLERFDLEPKERALVECLQAEPSDVDALVSGCGLPARRGRRLVYLLAIARAVTVYRPAEPTSEPPRSAAPPKPVAGRAPRAESPPEGWRPPGKTPLPGRTRHDSRLDTVAEPPEGLDPQLLQRWEEISDLAARIENMNYFEMLGLEIGAKSSAAKTAFWGLAKRWHPDRLPAALRMLTPVVETIFGYINEAHECLSEDERRLQYIQSIKAGGGTPAANRAMQKVVDAAMAYQRVEVLARKHEYRQALELLEEVIGLSAEEADYHAMRAWLLLQQYPGKDAPLRQILDSVDKALQLHQDHAKAHYCRGLVLKRMGRPKEALLHFKRTVEIDPKNVDAAREVRIAAMRENKSRQHGPRAGFVDKLLRRKK